MALSKAEKQKQLKAHKQCYVCGTLNYKHSSFTGYAEADIQFDHHIAKSLVGDQHKDHVENQWPIHAAKNGDDYKSLGFEDSTHRNCHKGKSNDFTGSEWVEFVAIYRKALKTQFSDDLFLSRKAGDKNFTVQIEWDEENATAEFEGIRYPLMMQVLENGDDWVSFSTVVKPSLLWVDRDVQSRPADKSRIAEMAWHLREKPLLTPILCRFSDHKLLVFDGNHRLCAFVLAREDHPIPVTIFKGPEPKKFLEVVAEAHDKLTQKKYQYTDKAIKFSAILEDEIEEATKKFGSEASEIKVWEGLSTAKVKLRLIGRVATSFEKRSKNWRHQWAKLGLTDASFTWMIAYYSKTEAEAAKFDSEDYLRSHELDNLFTLFDIFDEELFTKLHKFKAAKNSLKTKWWKLAHKRLRTRLGQVVKNSMKLSNTPEKPAYSPEWDNYIIGQLRQAVINWRRSSVWTADTTANNEPDVNAALQSGGFTEAYLIP